jgi:hypothetical protein
MSRINVDAFLIRHFHPLRRATRTSRMLKKALPFSIYVL